MGLPSTVATRFDLVETTCGKRVVELDVRDNRYYCHLQLPTARKAARCLPFDYVGGRINFQRMCKSLL
jgi:hypothetical protein